VSELHDLLIVGGGLSERELAWLVRKEWARSLEAVIWRRTKLGLVLDEAARARIAARLASLQSATQSLSAS
jgi:glycerol-3-phosphate dehydrogenase